MKKKGVHYIDTSNTLTGILSCDTRGSDEQHYVEQVNTRGVFCRAGARERSPKFV